MKIKAHVSDAKKKELKLIENLIETYPIIGVIDLMNLPTLQLQRIKHQLGDKIVLRATKKRLIKLALDKFKDKKKDIEKLKGELKGIPALIFTKEDPFVLAKLLNKNKSSAPAKPGQIAPNDLMVPAGPTNFVAGPMIGELGALGIKTKVEGGKISVLADKLLVREGEVINEKAADLLAKLGVEPMEIGLNLLLTYKDGEILPKEVLFVDEQEYVDNISKAGSEAVALALEIGYMVKDTAELLIAKAFREAEALKNEAKFEEKEETSLEKKPQEEIKVEEKKEEPKIEEKKPQPIETPKEEIKKEEPQIEEKPVEPLGIEEKPIKESEEVKETRLEKEIREQQEPQKEQAPKDPEDKKVVQAKPMEYKEELAKKAQEILNNLVTEKLKKQELIKKSNLRNKIEVDDVNKFINELKDKKSKGELK